MYGKQLYRNLSSSVIHFKSAKPKNTKGTSSHDWLSRQLSDPYVEKAKVMNYSAFKLLEIDDRFQLFQPGRTVVDCGAAPGSWTQVAIKRVNSDGSVPRRPRGKVISVDKQQIFPIAGATILGNVDFTDVECHRKIVEALGSCKPDAVISDMAPNATGIRDLDTENIIHLCYVALKFAIQVSKVGSSLIVKLWQCGRAKQLERDIGMYYEDVKYVKPNSSRSDSAEIFLLGRKFKGLLKE